MTRFLFIAFLAAYFSVNQLSSMWEAIEAEPPSSRPSFISAASACRIKGNISLNTGKRIYHMPGQEHYDETIITTSKGERWFCSEQAAQSAGWRKAR
jgi:hypothetical protein